VLLAPDGIALLDRAHLQLEDPFELSAEAAGAGGSVPEASGASGLAGQPPVPEAPSLRDVRRSVLERKIAEHEGNISALAADREVGKAFGVPEGPMPPSTLRLWIRNLGLEPRLHEAREQQRQGGPDLASIRAALYKHGSGSAAAKALKISRHALVWQLRKAGLSVKAVLGTGAD
jgi:hypothetical protein